jgi:hypothetical protein
MDHLRSLLVCEQRFNTGGYLWIRYGQAAKVQADLLARTLQVYHNIAKEDFCGSQFAC